MKLLLDENLSPRLVESLSEFYPDSRHVHEVGLGASQDGEIWAYAKANGFAIVSKDSDFVNSIALKIRPPKVIWIRLGNCSNSDIERLLFSQYDVIREFMEETVETCLILK